MNRLRLVFTCVALAALGAEDVAATPPGDLPVSEPVAVAKLPDFIMPVASDMRLGYSTNIGRYQRSQESGSATDGRFIEHGFWVSYVRALSGPGRAITGQAEWRAELGGLLSQAAVENPNGSTGTLQSAIVDLGIGPAWTLANSGSSRLQLELMPFIGIGRSRYTNRYTSQNSGASGSTSIDASGTCLEYGIKANLMWCWANGWGAAMHAGLVQRTQELSGDSSTSWNTGYVNNSDYTSNDTLTGVRFGLFVAKRF